MAGDDDDNFDVEIPGALNPAKVEFEPEQPLPLLPEFPDQPELPADVREEIDDIERGGRLVAEDMFDKGYQPVVLFGNAFSGKTSLLLSLFATIRTESRLDCGLSLAPPILSQQSAYGKYIQNHAESFWGRKTQDFIEGVASPKTVIDFPFFIPVTLTPNEKTEANFAFMESNGEWYRADKGSEKLFPALRKQIEDFMAHYQGGILFIHLIPYTQQSVRSATYDGSRDNSEIKEASLAIDGALQAYKRVRHDKVNDKHIMLVTKWDAHQLDTDRIDVLTDPDLSDVEEFVAQRYPQALASYKGLNLRPDQIALNSFCAGIMTEQGVLSLRPGTEMRAAVLSYPIRLWGWLYREAMRNSDGVDSDPFPSPPPESPLVQKFHALMDRWF